MQSVRTCLVRKKITSSCTFPRVQGYRRTWRSSLLLFKNDNGRLFREFARLLASLHAVSETYVTLSLVKVMDLYIYICRAMAEVLLYVHRNRRLIRDGSPGRPPRLSHSS